MYSVALVHTYAFLLIQKATELYLVCIKCITVNMYVLVPVSFYGKMMYTFGD